MATTIRGGGTGGEKALPSLGGLNSATGVGGDGAYNGLSGGGGGAGAGQGGQGGGDSGGDGGVHGYVGSVQMLVSAIGSHGGSGQYGWYGLDGGGGGGGGYGAVITSSGDLGTITASLAGGAGGDGGGSQSWVAGSGGRGGIGLYLNDTSGVSFTLASVVAGGSGGKAGLGWGSLPSNNGYAGLGGEGIYGQNLSITLASGSVVTGGIGGDGVRAAAIYLEAGTNLLDIQGGTILGNIVGGSGTDTFRLSGDTGGTFDMSTLSNFETLGSAGTATWTLTGTSATVQTWTASSGQLLVKATLANTAVTVEADATLGGTGAVGAVIVDGTLGPGVGRGVLTTGDLSFGTAGVFEIEITGTAAGKFDQVAVNGNVSLDGVLDIALLKRFAPSVGDSFTIISNDGTDAVSGTFDGLAEGAVVLDAGRGLQISYAGGDGNDVVLTSVSLAPTVATNTPLTLAEGATRTITAADLAYADVDQTADNLTYTLGTVTNGAVLKNGTVLGKGGTFTQDDIDQGIITFRHDGSETSAASFGFSVSDGQGNKLTGQSYAMTVTPVDDAPRLAATATNATFTEGQAAADVFGSVSVDTVEYGQAITGITLTVSGLKDGNAERLTIDGTTIVLAAGAGTTNGGLGYAVSLAGGVATVTLTSNGLTPAEAERLIDTLTYANISDDPTDTERIVTVNSLTDTGSTANGGKATGAVSVVSTVHVAAVDDAPTDITVTPLSGKVLTVAENAAGASLGTVTASDPDDTVFSYRVDDARFEVVNGTLRLKSGLSLDYEAASSVTLEITAVDSGNLAVTRAVTVTVTDINESQANSAPTVSNANADMTLQAGTALAFIIGDGHFSDPEGADLDYAITVDGAAKPGWLTFDSETGLLTGTPTTSEAGNYVIRITASDGSLTATDEFTLVVTNPASAIDTTGTRKDDVIVGDAGNNDMDGRGGNDKLTGGAGADTFVLDQNYGRDVVTDFHPEEGDLIDLSGAIGISGYKDLMNHHVSQSGDDVKIRADDGSVLVIRDFDLADLEKDMFLF